MRRRIVWVVSIFALLACGAYLVIANQRGGSRVTAVQIGVARTGSIERTMRLGGTTSSRVFVNIAAPRQEGPEAGRDLILIELVKPGSLVKKGDLLARIDAQALKDHVDDLSDTIHQAQADIVKRQAEQAVEWEDLQQAVRVAKADLDKARLDYKTAALLTGIERELLKLSVDEASARYEELLKRSALKKDADLAELRILELTAQRHRNHLGRHARDLTRFTIHSPIDGLAVMETIWREADMGQVQKGDQVRPGQIFMKVVDPSAMRVRAFANQAESADLRPGQKAIVRLDAFPDVRLSGNVASVGALASSSGWRQSYFVRRVPVDVDIDGQDPRLIPDLSASADVTLAETGPSVVVALSALRRKGSETFVTVRSGGRFSTRVVTLGLADNVQAQIQSGLAAGEEVRLN